MDCDDKTQERSRRTSQDVQVRPCYHRNRVRVITTTIQQKLICVRPHSKPSWPVLKAREQFKGDVLHAFSFKEPAKYEGKTVVVVGFNATAADSIEYLRKARAKKIYVSHRRSVVVVSVFGSQELVPD